MDEFTATCALATSVRNSVQRLIPGLDSDALYDAIHDGLIANWDQFIEAASLAFVQREIYAHLKLRFEGNLPDNAM
jgi:hypothetical protein